MNIPRSYFFFFFTPLNFIPVRLIPHFKFEAIVLLKVCFKGAGGWRREIISPKFVSFLTRKVLAFKLDSGMNYAALGIPDSRLSHLLKTGEISLWDVFE